MRLDPAEKLYEHAEELSRHDAKIDHLEARFDRLEDQVTGLGDRIDGKLDRVLEGLNSNEKRISSLEGTRSRAVKVLKWVGATVTGIVLAVLGWK
jgi:chromosome segregation ATPase